MNTPDKDALHAAIMNLPMDSSFSDFTTLVQRTWYSLGFRDARCAAAELVASHPAEMMEAEVQKSKTAHVTSAVPSGVLLSALTFDAFRQANVTRCVKWHPEGIASWSPSDWLTAVTGELGELASLLKMRNRERDGLPGNKFSPTDKMIADELADVLTYLDLLAEVLGVNLGAAAVTKFNEVSERVGFSDRIVLAASEAVSGSAIPNEGSQAAHPTSACGGDDLQTALLVLRAIRSHWREFGPYDGFDELLETACKSLIGDAEPQPNTSGQGVDPEARKRIAATTKRLREIEPPKGYCRAIVCGCVGRADQAECSNWERN